jgi:protein SCO1/2
MTALGLIRYGSWVAVAALGIVIAVVLLNPAKRPEQGAGRVGGPFKLAMAGGGTIDSASLAGKPYGLFFGFTQCPDVCPGTLTEMTALFDEVDKGVQATRAKDFRLFFVTVDPERDTAELLKNYLSAFDHRVVGLVPTMEILPALAKQFAAFYEKIPTSSGYTMNHTAAVYLFDSKGAFSGTLDYRESRENQLQKLTRLLAR